MILYKLAEFSLGRSLSDEGCIHLKEYFGQYSVLI